MSESSSAEENQKFYALVRFQNDKSSTYVVDSTQIRQKIVNNRGKGVLLSFEPTDIDDYEKTRWYRCLRKCVKECQKNHQHDSFDKCQILQLDAEKSKLEKPSGRIKFPRMESDDSLLTDQSIVSQSDDDEYKSLTQKNLKEKGQKSAAQRILQKNEEKTFVSQSSLFRHKTDFSIDIEPQVIIKKCDSKNHPSGTSTCIACAQGHAPSGHQCALCKKKVHNLDMCSLPVNDDDEGYGQKRLCYNCYNSNKGKSMINEASVSKPAGTVSSNLTKPNYSRQLFGDPTTKRKDREEEEVNDGEIVNENIENENRERANNQPNFNIPSKSKRPRLTEAQRVNLINRSKMHRPTKRAYTNAEDVVDLNPTNRERFVAVGGVVYLGLDVEVDEAVWTKAIRKTPFIFLREAAEIIWTAYVLANRIFDLKKCTVKKFEGRSPRKEVEHDKWCLLEDVFKWYLKNVKNFDDILISKYFNNMRDKLKQKFQELKQTFEYVPDKEFKD